MTPQITSGAQQPKPRNVVVIPPLRNGDHLTREEFHRRYEAMPQLKKAELINGVVYMPSPVSIENHAEQTAHFITWGGVYVANTPGLRVANDATVRLDMANEPQPDVLLMIKPERGGRATIAEGYVTGGPELAIEVAASSVSIDRNAKFNAYRSNGVCEYILWRVEDQQIDWFVLRHGTYVPMPTPQDGIQRSEVFPGLWLAVDAMLRLELLTVLNVLQRGLVSAAHAEFVERLRMAPGMSDAGYPAT
jgi:Uma2 family endonuclease